MAPGASKPLSFVGLGVTLLAFAAVGSAFFALLQGIWSRIVIFMARRKLSTTVYITPEQDTALKLLHARTKVPVAEYIRQGIDLALAKYRDHLPGQVDLELAEQPPTAPPQRTAGRGRRR